MGREYAVDGEKPKRDHESGDERDKRLESRYAYDRRGYENTLAFVAVFAPDLAAEFFAWRAGRRSGPWQDPNVLDTLPAFEAERFGYELDESPHRLLLFHVRCRLSPSDGGRQLETAYYERTEGIRHKRFGSISRLARGMTMPHQPNVERRANELREQAIE